MTTTATLRSSVSDHVGHIAPTSIPTQIVEPVVAWISVAVAALHQWRTRADECSKYYSSKVCVLSVDGGVNSGAVEIPTDTLPPASQLAVRSTTPARKDSAMCCSAVSECTRDVSDALSGIKWRVVHALNCSAIQLTF